MHPALSTAGAQGAEPITADVDPDTEHDLRRGFIDYIDLCLLRGRIDAAEEARADLEARIAGDEGSFEW